MKNIFIPTFVLVAGIVLSACSIQNPQVESPASPSPQSSPIASPVASAMPSPSPIVSPSPSAKPANSQNNLIQFSIANGCALKGNTLPAEQMRSIGEANMKKYGVTPKQLSEFSLKLYSDPSYAAVKKQIDAGIANCQ
ncbi:MAG TPA: hypothetical protein VD999_02920 [Vitreimonas sp.]|nr:hypothetical protein [Vitreimonas sp.]